jgi:hypothetical protein
MTVGHENLFSFESELVHIKTGIALIAIALNGAEH